MGGAEGCDFNVYVLMLMDNPTCICYQRKPPPTKAAVQNLIPTMLMTVSCMTKVSSCPDGHTHSVTVLHNMKGMHAYTRTCNKTMLRYIVNYATKVAKTAGATSLWWHPEEDCEGRVKTT